MDLSIVVPFYNEEDSLQELVERIYENVLPLNLKFELLFIDDGSTDDSFNRLLKSKEKHAEIKIIRFRKNFGKSTALSEGFNRAQGKIVITWTPTCRMTRPKFQICLKNLTKALTWFRAGRKNATTRLPRRCLPNCSTLPLVF
ncbi:MAG: glycosyltransferase [Caldisericaceae bacterium]|nr:glycosyltransferase [Caldisericaceae bacterium]